MYEQIKKIIQQKKNDIDDRTLTYFTNYFYVATIEKVIPENITLEELIDNVLYYASKIEFYNNSHRLAKKYGTDAKGFQEPKTKTIYIRQNLKESLKEIMIYHEIHHAAQTNRKNDRTGINQKGNLGRLILEAQTQYFAEIVYQRIHNVQFENKKIPSEELRMQKGGTILSSLHNYEMYDNLLSNLSILLNVPKTFFVTINYQYQKNEGLKQLKKLYKKAYKKYHLPWKFHRLLLILDHIYYTDLLAYLDNPEKQTILSGKETKKKYKIHPHKKLKCSLQEQMDNINRFDKDTFFALIKNKGNYKEFAKYIVDNTNRETTKQYIESLTENLSMSQ